ncbi:MAG: recombination mediator RecR [Candidatus Brocadiia bacterium]
MAEYSPTVVTLITHLGDLPGIGKKTAERLAFYLLNCDEAAALALADSIRAVREKMKICSVCFNICEESPCEICSDPGRLPGFVAVVETAKDLAVIEHSITFRGKYHVLGGHLSPLNNIGPDDLNIIQLVERIRSGEIKEVVFATNPTTEGDTTAHYVAELIRPLGVKISRLARGLPVGSEIEFAPRGNLNEAMKGRQEF